MKSKKIIITLMLAVFIISMSCVWASDAAIASENNTSIGQTMETTDGEILSASNDETVSAETDLDVLCDGESTYSDLSNQIGQLSSTNKNITLKHAYYKYDQGADPISIGIADSVIDGNGSTIDMNGSTIRAFEVKASGVTIKNLTIKNAKFNGDGGAIYFNNDASSGTVTNCNFTNNSASGFGCAIWMLSGSVENCNFTGNKANGDHVYGGAIWMSSGTVTNCNFTNNTASEVGGAIWMYSGNVTNCKFTKNTAITGGAVCLESNGNVTNCNFTGNKANGAYVYGGAILMSSGTVTNCNFNDNQVIGYGCGGGAIWMSSGTVTNCNFNDNQVIGDDCGGGAVYFYNQGTVTNCNFTGNNATTGSAIYLYTNFYSSGTLTISNSTFLNNRANVNKNTPLNVIINENNITIIFMGQNNLLNAIYSGYDAEFSFTNVTYWGAKGIANTGSSPITPSRSNKEAGQKITVEIYDSNDNLVENVTFVTDDNGQVTYDFIKLSNGNYKYKAYHSQDCYYTYAECNGAFTLDSDLGDFNRLQKYINGAGENSTLTLCRDYTFTIGSDENLVDGIVIDKQLTINGNGHTIDAKGKSRIFYVTAGSINITNVTLKNGKADRGGAIYFSNAISDSNINATFINNTATIDGGANYFRGSVSGSNITGTYTNNTATYWGGANCFFDRVSGSNINGMYTSNNATYYGGANYFHSSVSDSNVTGTYTGNNATYLGGANYFDDSVSDSNIGGTYAGNTATNGNGGANFFSGSVSDSNINGTYTNNTANGQGIYDGGGANYFNWHVSGSNITGTYINNTANGQSIFNSGGANYFRDSVSDSNINGTYTNNNATRNGGANYFMGSVSDSKVTGTYTGNNAKSGGANGFYFGVSGSNVTGIYINNTAQYSIIYVIDPYTQGLDVEITNAIFLNNKCEYEVYAGDPGVVAKNNWFGNNATNYKTAPKTTGIQMDSWLFLNATANPNSISVFDSSNILFKLYSTNGTHIFEYDNSKLPVVNLTLTATNGEVSNNTPLDQSVEYMPTKVGQGSVTASVEDAEYTIFLDNNKRDVNLSVAVDPQVIDYGENAAVILEYNVTATGTVNITLKGKKHNQTIDKVALNKTITLPDNILPDEYEVIVSYSGDDIFTNSSAASSLTVNKLKSDIKVVGYDIYVNDTTGLIFTVTLPENATGNLTINNTITLNVTKEGRKENNSLIIELMNDAYSVGEYNWTFTYSDDDIYENSKANATANILIIPTEITANVTSSLFVDDTDQVTYNLTPDDAVGNVKFTSNDTSVVEVDQDGNIRAISEGTAIITVTFEGSKNYTASSTNVTVTVSKIATEITLKNATLELKAYGNIGDLATLAPADAGNLTYASSDEDIVLVSEEGIIYARIKGTATVTVSFAGDDKYKAAENKTIAVTVTLNDASVSVENDTIDLYVDDTFIIDATANPRFLAVYYASSNESVATVTEYGNVKAVGEGTAVITLTVGNGETYAINSTNVTVTVSKVPTEINIENDTLKLEVTDEVAAGATLTPADAGNVTYTISNSSIVKIKDGRIIALAEGEATVTVSFAGDYKYAGAENKTINVSVSLKPASVSVNNDTLDLFVDDTFNLVATTTPESLTVNFTSSNPSVVTVDNGNVVAVGEGTVNITVKVGGDGVYTENSTTVTVTVSKIPTEIKIDSPVGEMSAGAMGHVAAELIPSEAGNLSYASNDTSVASVSSTGVIKANKAGTALITVSFAGDDKYAAAENKTITLTVNLNDASVSVNNSTLELLVDDNFTIVAVTVPAGLNVTYVPDNSGVVSVDNDGVVTALKEGTASIIVKVGGDGVYAENSTTVAVTVSKIPTEIIVQNATVDMKVTDEVDSVVSLMPSGAGELDFISSDVSVVTVDGIGTITAVGEGVANVTVRFIGNDKYLAAESKNITVTVSLKDAGVSVNNSTLDLNVDDTFTIVATTAPEGLNVTYVPDNSGVYSIDDKGVVTALKEGTATIVVKVGGDGIYAENSTAIAVTVNKQDANASVSIPENVTVGDNSTVNVKLPSDATGNVTVKVDGEVADTVQVTDGSADVTIPSLSAGNHTVEIAYSGDGKYNPSNETKEITVSKKDTTPDITIPSDITVGDDSSVNVTLPSDATGNVTLKVDGEVVDTVPVSNGTASVELPDLSAGNHTVEIAYSGDDKYSPVTQTKEITVSKKETTPEIAVDGSNVDVKLPNDATGNVTVKVDDTVIDTVPVTEGTASVKLPKLSAGNHTVEIAYSGDGKYSSSTETATVSGDIDSTRLAADNVTATYNVKKYLTITLTDSSGSPIANATVSVKLKSLKNYTTDANGQVKVKVSSLVPKTYTAKITFKGDDSYTGSSATAKVTVKKAASKLTAKAKTFKTTTKTKKYTVTLKNSKGKALKNKTVYLKVKGKTYKAKTNSKGKATFKITKLNKKGSFKATVTFKGNDYYKKATKKVKITVKSVFKTISKGSKNKAIVKKIQRALKNNGYYLVYNGHYLKVDGIFWDYTEMAVKEFQHDKKLKVTGKVDEKTAKKLKII